MDDVLIQVLLELGYLETAHVSEPGIGIVKATYENETGHSLDVYHRKFSPRG